MGARLKRWLVVLAALVVVPLLVLGAALLWTSHSRQQGLIALYEETAVASRTRQYPRPSGPRGWKLLEGEAAGHYREAWGGFDPLEWPNEANMSLIQTRIAILEPGLRAMRADDLALWPVGERPVPDACLSAGVPADSDSLVVAQLHGELCEQLAAHGAALEQVRLGSWSAEASFPLAIWSDFAVEPSGDLRSVLPYFRLAQLELLGGHLAAVAGDRGRYLEGIFTVLRLGHDLGHGTGLIGAMSGVAICDRASRDLEWLLRRDELTAVEARRAYRELAYVNAQPLNTAEALQGEFLVTGSMWLSPGAVDPPLASLMVGTTQLGFTDRFVMHMACAEIEWMWREILGIQSRPYPERAREYARIAQRVQAFDHPLAAVQPDFGRFDARTTSARSRLAMLQVAVAETVYRREIGELATDIDQLENLVDGLPLDPLTGEPFVVEARGDRRYLSSEALRAGSSARLGLDELEHQMRPEVYLQVELPTSVED